MNDRANALGEFLRARRELMDPSAFALPDTGPRRVAGLRRDEVALLAGVSKHYYARLEQGRDRHPSDAVLDALARVMGLDDAGVGLLRRLARPGPTPARRDRNDTIDPGLATLVRGWADYPAVVVGRYREVLASNDVALFVNPGFEVGRNLLVDVFLDPAARHLYMDWEDVAASAVAAVRASAGDDLDDPRFRDVIGELSLKSDEFRQLWARHDVVERRRGTKRYDTAMAGPITLRYDSFAVTAAPGQTLFVYHAEPGSESEQSLRLLNSLADTRRAERRHEGGTAVPSS